PSAVATAGRGRRLLGHRPARVLHQRVGGDPAGLALGVEGGAFPRGQDGDHCSALTATQNAAAIRRSWVRATLTSVTPSRSARFFAAPSRINAGAPVGARSTRT